MADLSLVSDSDLSNPDAIILRCVLKVIEVAELPKWRLVDKFCNATAIRHMQHGGVTATIRDDEEMESFLGTMATRFQLIPFRSFSLALGCISTVNIQRFVATVRGGVDRYKFSHFLPQWDPYELLFFPEDIQMGFTQNGIQSKVLALLGATPNLRELILCADGDLVLTSAELDLLPPIFLYLTRLVVDYVCVFAEEGNDLVSAVIGRAPKLDQLTLKVWDGPNSLFNAKIPTFLYGLPRLQPPSLTLGTEITSAVEDREMIRKLVEKGYNRLTQFIICFVFDDRDDLLWNTVMPLLELQHSLETFVIQGFNHRNSTQVPMRLPSLPKLKTLILTLVFKEETSPIGPFLQDQFPMLEELCLYGAYVVEHGLLGEAVIPSLRRLVLWDYQGSAQDETFHHNFPNLKSLEMELRYGGLSFLEFAMTHLTGIENLELGSSMPRSGMGIECQLWNLYTGNQERMTKGSLIQACKAGQAQTMTELVNPEPVTPSEETPAELPPPGTHQLYIVPSLANFKNLKELKVWARTMLEIEALVFMSRPGGLPVLDKLILGYHPIGRRFGFNEEDDEAEESVYDTIPPRTELSSTSAVPVDFPNELLPSEQSDVSSTSSTDVEHYTQFLTTVAHILQEHEELEPGPEEAQSQTTAAETEEEETETEDEEDDSEDDDAEFRIDIGLGLQGQFILPHKVTVAESGIDVEYISILENYHKNVILLMSA